MSRYKLAITGPAARAIQRRLPEPVAVAVLEFLHGALLDNPRRVGKPLHRELSGQWSARRGTYRIVYWINEERNEVVVMRVDHRRDVYRT